MAEEAKKNSTPSDKDEQKVPLTADDKIVSFQSDIVMRNESKEERLKRIAEMFLAKPGNKEDRKEMIKDIQNKDKKLSERMNKKMAKKNKRKERAEKKKHVIKDVTERDGHNVTKPFEDFIEIEAEDGVDICEKHPGCLGFIRAWFENRKEKRRMSERCASFSDIFIEIPESPRADCADDLTGNGLKGDAFEVKNVEANEY